MGEAEEIAIRTRAQDLAESGEYEGFNVLSATLDTEFGAVAVDVVRRDTPFRDALTDTCQAAWARRRSR